MGTDGVEWLGLMGLPMMVLRRPRSWPLMDELGRRLVEELAQKTAQAVPA